MFRKCTLITLVILVTGLTNRAPADWTGAVSSDWYEAANGAGPLMIELLRLHLILTGTDYHLATNYSDI